MTPSKKDELLELHKAASKGPWHASCYLDDDNYGIVSKDNLIIFPSNFRTRPEDARYAAAACNALPGLIQTIERLERELADAKLEISALKAR
jgi:hypothetical protein